MWSVNITHTQTNTSPRDLAGILQQRTIAVVVLVAPRVTCSYPGGSKGFASSLLPFSWGTNLRVALCDLGWTFIAGVWGMHRDLPARDNHGLASTVQRVGKPRGWAASGRRVRFCDSAALQLAPLHRGLRYESRRSFLPCPEIRLLPSYPSPGTCSNMNSRRQ